MSVTAAQIGDLLLCRRLPVGSEEELQQGIASALVGASIVFAREYRLTPRDRLDFFINGIAVEVKLDGSLPALTRQLHRYAQHDDVRELVVVTTRARLTQVPPELGGKPVTVVSLLEMAL